MKAFTISLSLMLSALAGAAEKDWVWIEGEAATDAKVSRGTFWYDKVKKEVFSGNDFISNWTDKSAGELTYKFQAPGAGEHVFWVRANPTGARLSYSVNGGAFQAIDFSGDQKGNMNVAEGGALDIRFLTWVNVGRVPLKAGENEVRFRMDSPNNNHGMLDCFMFTRGVFSPSGASKPDEIQKRLAELGSALKGWTMWNPGRDEFKPSVIDLRPLNEKVAGADGYVRVENGRFVLGSGKPVRFWGVNGAGASSKGEELRRSARALAKRGVNLVRVDGKLYDSKTGEVSLEKVAEMHELVAALKAEGICTHLILYFPLWFTPQADLPYLKGYDGKKFPMAALFFNSEFQKVYMGWWKALLTTPGAKGQTLLTDPAIMGLEVLNEDSYFFWTFNYDALPKPQMEMVEGQFAAWVLKKYGTLEKAYAAWNGMKLPRDTQDRLAFRGHYVMAAERTKRDQDTAAFLYESQRNFYQFGVDGLRKLGYKGLITAGNWITANDDIFGPLERASYLPGDFIDRHGYFSGEHKGEGASYSVREGHSYRHRSGLSFEAEKPGRPLAFTNPIFDLTINGKPSMISETTFTRPNRFRTEAPLFYAAYGALQGSDAIMNFAFDTAEWEVKPGMMMSPWTLSTPAMMGQFPAAALIYRLGWIDEGEVMADVNLTLEDAKALKGSPLSQQANLDELRKADVKGSGDAAGKGKAGAIDPRVHLIGKTGLNITDTPGKTTLRDLAPFIDDAGKTVTSSNKQLVLNYGKRLLRLDSAKAQGIVGDLKSAGTVELPQLVASSDLDLGSVVLVSLDGAPLSVSKRMLLQVMSEERPSNFVEEPTADGLLKIIKQGEDPWIIRDITGTVKLRRPDASSLKVTGLDGNGYPKGEAGNAAEIKLQPGVAYYSITK